MRNMRCIVYLTGGLGNQLFQLAAALTYCDESEREIVLDTSLGKPRKTAGQADICTLSLPPKVSPLNKPSSFLVQKTSGFMLRKGIEPSSLEMKTKISKILDSCGKAILSLRYKMVIGLFVSSNLGYEELAQIPNETVMLIGYFQSYRYSDSERVFSKLFSMSPNSLSEKTLRYISMATSQKPIFLHFRFQDYLQEKDFGIPSISYYEASLDLLNASNREIWVFSDDIEMAKCKLKDTRFSNSFFVEDSGMSTAEVLHLFRHGADYVIANSSFSWWGAHLRFNRTSRVVAPRPWFKLKEEPRELIHPSWIRKETQD